MKMIEINNKKAYFDYYIEETYEAGIVLTGTEIKSIRKGSANLKDCYARVKNSELMLINMLISPYEEGNRFNVDERRTRKLLMHKKEILKLEQKIEKEGYTLIPVKLYFKNGKVKILLGLGKGKKLFNKKQAIKERELSREAEKDLSNLNKY
ncbi:MAG TPA: SsrA-binding protein SmpB [Bacilli bacterium]|nr:SsrA-binding protein SmpB [Bacilli bacterium]